MKITKSQIKYRVTPLKRGKQQKELSKLINKEHMVNYLKQELGNDYWKGNTSDGHVLYSNDNLAIHVEKTVGDLEKQ